MNNDVGDYDVVILGAGFAGLMSARRLARIGYRVAVIDKAEQILAGTSSRNEGWLHAGTYHATSIADPEQARTVAGRCKYGWTQIQREFPECVEREQQPAYAVVREDGLTRVLDRWNEAAVVHRAARAHELDRLSDTVAIAATERVYAVADLGINVRILAARLVAEIRLAGGEILLGCTAQAAGTNRLTLTGVRGRHIGYRLLICSTGYATTAVCADLGLPAPAIRLWRSHLVSAPRLAPASVFALAPGEAAMINHQAWSVAGLNEDATVVPEPVFDPDPAVVDRLESALRRRFPRADARDLRATACVKVDVLDSPGAVRSLNVQISTLAQSVLGVLPGKMTETPYTADTVASLAFDLLDAPRVRYRPIDTRALDKLEELTDELV